MNTVLHVVTNAGTWRGQETLPLIDAQLNASGSIPVHVRWEGIEMDDPDHFTEAGSKVFARRFVDAVMPHLKTSVVHVITDSTVDHNDWSEDGMHHHREASERIVQAFRSRAILATVDAVSGSGFVARANEGKHFRARLVPHVTGYPRKTIVFMGGWNDATSGYAVPRILHAVQACVHAARHGLRPTAGRTT